MAVIFQLKRLARQRRTLGGIKGLLGRGYDKNEFNTINGEDIETPMRRPTSGKSDYTETKIYHPISLPYFLSKTMEKLMDRHIRDGELKECPLRRNKLVNPPKLHFTVCQCIDYTSEHKEIAVDELLDASIVESFGRTPSDVAITQFAKGHDIYAPSACISGPQKPHLQEKP
jgi:hypothetical protein